MKRCGKWILLIILLCVLLWIFLRRDSYKDKLIKIGYKNNEIKVILENVPKDKYDKIIHKHYDGLIDLITSKGYKAKNFDK